MGRQNNDKLIAHFNISFEKSLLPPAREMARQRLNRFDKMLTRRDGATIAIFNFQLVACK